MPTRYRPYDPNQSYLLPPNPRDWLPEDHLAYFISDTVDEMDLSALYRPYEGDGRRNRPFDPRMMVKVLLYGYATGVTSSRKIARRIQEDVAFRMLAAGNEPAHRTIAEFRQKHLREFQGMFVQVVRIAQEAGLIKMGTLVVDGAKVRANASKRKAMSYKRMKEEDKRLEREIRELLEQAEAEDAREDELYGRDRTGYEVPEELRRREDRQKKIREAMKRLKERQEAEDREAGREPGDEERKGKKGPKYRRKFGEPEERAQTNFTDPDSRIMKTSTEGYQQCYNGQIAVDGQNQLIVANGLTQSAGEQKQLLGLLDQAREITRQGPKRMLADAGYKAEANFRALEERGIEAYVSLAREGKVSGSVGQAQSATRRMEKRLATKKGRRWYRRRKAIVEAVFGWIKEAQGFRRFRLRGFEKVTGEWSLVCLATNLKRMSALMEWA